MTGKATHNRKTDHVYYQVYPFDLNIHCYTVICRVNRPDPSGQRFSLPAWIPGSYKIRDFAKHVMDIAAEANGKRLPIHKIDKHTWQTEPTRYAITMTYRVYAQDPSVRGAWLSFDRGFFNGTSLFLKVDQKDQKPHIVDIYRPIEAHTKLWAMATMLPRIDDLPEGFGIYRAENYDQLIDSPVSFGQLQYGFFEAFGIQHSIAIAGAPDPVNMTLLAKDCQRLCETQLKFFGHPYPISNYLFLINVVSNGLSGLEHRDSCALQCTRENLPVLARKLPRRYVPLLRLISHEYFHLWWVKRVRPEAFALSDLAQEAYSTQLWIFEGMTAYYEDLLLARSGLISENEFLNLVALNIQSVELSTGSQLQSVAESSFDAWIKFYQQEEVSPHAVSNYYVKGAMIALCLDLTIRLQTKERFSLDSVIYACWQRFSNGQTTLKEGEFEEIAEKVTGCQLTPLIKQWVYGTANLPYEKLLKKMSITLNKSYVDHPSMGMSLIEKGALLKVDFIEYLGAAQKAGLLPGDFIVAFNHQNVTLKKLDYLLDSMFPSMSLEIAFLRDNMLGYTRLILDVPALDQITLTVSRQRRITPAQLFRLNWLSQTRAQDNTSLMMD